MSLIWLGCQIPGVSKQLLMYMYNRRFAILGNFCYSPPLITLVQKYKMPSALCPLSRSIIHVYTSNDPQSVVTIRWFLSYKSHCKPLHVIIQKIYICYWHAACHANVFTGFLLAKTGEFDLVCFNFPSLLPSFFLFFFSSPFPPLKKNNTPRSILGGGVRRVRPP